VVDQGGNSLCDDSDACTTDLCGGVSGCSRSPFRRPLAASEPGDARPAQPQARQANATIEATRAQARPSSRRSRAMSPMMFPGPPMGTPWGHRGRGIGTADFSFRLRAEADKGRLRANLHRRLHRDG
jgi:hypothetical protein